MKSYDERLLDAAHKVIDTAPRENPMGGIKPEGVVAIAVAHRVTAEELDSEVAKIFDEGFRTYPDEDSELSSFVESPGKDWKVDRGEEAVYQSALRLERNPAFKSLDEGKLYQVAQMRVVFIEDLDKSNLDSHVFQDRLEKFDNYFSKPENLDAYLAARNDALDKSMAKTTVDLDVGQEL